MCIAEIAKLALEAGLVIDLVASDAHFFDFHKTLFADGSVLVQIGDSYTVLDPTPHALEYHHELSLARAEEMEALMHQYSQFATDDLPF